jgi:hypothetical protein
MASCTFFLPPHFRGGEWLLQDPTPASVFTPERTTEEHRLIAQTVADFVNNEVLPVLDRLEEKDWDLARQLVRRWGPRVARRRCGRDMRRGTGQGDLHDCE